MYIDNGHSHQCFFIRINSRDIKKLMEEQKLLEKKKTLQITVVWFLRVGN